MRHLIAWISLAIWSLALPAVAQGTDIQSTITAQIEAFQADDVERAYSYASPTIQNMFRTPETFGAMVQRGYPMVWRPAEVRYLDLREVAGNLWQRVMVTDQSGKVHFFDYQMIETEDGWKINAVHRVRAPEPSA